MTTKDPELSIEYILDASRAPGQDNVYVLGPYSRYVSFSSRQRRAFDLISALIENNELNPNDQIAIVGGSLTGISLAAASSHFVAKVTLFEEAIERGIAHPNTAHRYVHPTINFWPQAPLSERIALPFLDWQISSAREILKETKTAWLDHGDDINKELISGTKVLEISGGDSVRLRTRSSRGEEQRLFDKVFIVSDSPSMALTSDQSLRSYWVDPPTDVAESGDPKKHWVIIGDGDGAVLDALRIIHRDFDDGLLINEFGRQLMETEWPGEDLVIALERKLQNLDSADQEIGFDGYSRILDELPKKLIDMLNASYRSGDFHHVTFLSPARSLFTQLIAPIHKILIAHAFKQSLVNHVVGKAIKIGPSWVTYWPGPEFEDGEEERRLNGDTIIHHGNELFSPLQSKGSTSEKVDLGAVRQATEKASARISLADRNLLRERLTFLQEHTVTVSEVAEASADAIEVGINAYLNATKENHIPDDWLLFEELRDAFRAFSIRKTPATEAEERIEALEEKLEKLLATISDLTLQLEERTIKAKSDIFFEALLAGAGKSLGSSAGNVVKIAIAGGVIYLLGTQAGDTMATRFINAMSAIFTR